MGTSVSPWLTACTSGECESRNIQSAVTSLPVTLPFPWQHAPAAYHASVLGEVRPRTLVFPSMLHWCLVGKAHYIL
jgi:hypothetical protein